MWRTPDSIGSYSEAASVESVQAVKVRARFVLKQGLDRFANQCEHFYLLTVFVTRVRNSPHEATQVALQVGGVLVLVFLTSSVVTALSTERFIVRLPVLFSFVVRSEASACR